MGWPKLLWLLQPHRPPRSNLGGWGLCHTEGSTSPGKGRGELCHRVPLLPPAVMKFMGDHPPRGQTELDIVCTILKVNPVPGVVAAGPSPATERAVPLP